MHWVQGARLAQCWRILLVVTWAVHLPSSTEAATVASDAQSFVQLVSSWAYSGGSSTILLPAGVTSLRGVPFPAYNDSAVPLAASGTLTIQAEDKSHPGSAVVVDAAMRHGLTPAPNGGVVHVDSITFVNMCEGFILQVSTSLPPLPTSTSFTLFNRTRVYKSLWFTKSVGYVRHADVMQLLYLFAVSATPFTQVTELVAPLQANAVRSNVQFSWMRRYSIQISGLTTSTIAENTTLISLHSPSDPLITSLRSSGALMPPQFCNGTLLPDSFVTAEVQPLAPAWVSEDTATFLADVVAAWQLAAQPSAWAPPPMLVLSGQASLASSTPLPALPPLNASIILMGPPNDVPAYAVASVLDLGGVSGWITLVPGGQLFIQHMAFTGLATRTLTNTSGVQLSELLSALPLAAINSSKVSLSGAAGPAAINMYNVSLQVMPADYRALAALAMCGLSCSCVGLPGMQSHAAALQQGISSISLGHADATAQVVILKSFVGWGLNASYLTISPSEPTPLPSCPNGSSGHTGLSKRQLAGVVVGVTLGGLLLVTAAAVALLWWWQHRQGARKPASTAAASAASSPRKGFKPSSRSTIASQHALPGSEAALGPPSGPRSNLALRVAALAERDTELLGCRAHSYTAPEKGASPVCTSLWLTIQSVGAPHAEGDQQAEERGSPGPQQQQQQQLTQQRPEMQRSACAGWEELGMLLREESGDVHAQASSQVASGPKGRQLTSIQEQHSQDLYTTATSGVLAAPAPAQLVPTSMGSQASQGTSFRDAESSERAAGCSSGQQVPQGQAGAPPGWPTSDGTATAATNATAAAAAAATGGSTSQGAEGSQGLGPGTGGGPMEGHASRSRRGSAAQGGHAASRASAVDSDHVVLSMGGSSTPGSNVGGLLDSQHHDQIRAIAKGLSSEANEVAILGVLGTGASGTVYKGRWRGLPVALKTFVFEELDEAARSHKAIMEAAISASVGHRNVVSTYTYDIKPVNTTMASGLGGLQVELSGDLAQHPTKGSCAAYKMYLVQELCNASLGGLLTDSQLLHSPDTGAVDHVSLFAILLDVLQGLQYLHARGIIHGDLKPDNILIKPDTTVPAGIVAKLADFGLSAHVVNNATHVSNYTCGTPFYVAPEVVQQHRASPASDMYSFGILMWQLYTGQQPYKVVENGQFVWNPLLPKYTPPHIPPPGYELLANRCLQHVPAVRPTAAQLLRDLYVLINWLPDLHRPGAV